MKAIITIPRCTNVGNAIKDHFTNHTFLGEVAYGNIDIQRDNTNKVIVATVEYTLLLTHKDN